VGFSTLNNSDGSSVAYGPCAFSATGKDGALVVGSRAHFFFPHPTTGKMLMSGVTKSGAASLSYGPSFFGDPDWPTPSTAATNCGATPTPITQASRYLNYYHPAGINYDGSYTGDLTAMRFPTTMSYIFERFPAFLADSRIDPGQNGGVGNWGDVDGCNGGTWLELTNVHGVAFFCTLVVSEDLDPTHSGAAHEYYVNKGQFSMYLSSTTGFIPGGPGEQIRGLTSGSRGYVGALESGVGIQGTQPLTRFTLTENITGASSGAACSNVTDTDIQLDATVYAVCAGSSGTFTVGEFAEGGTSHSYGKVLSWNGSTKVLVVDEQTNFTEGETIHGQTSGSNATISGKPAGTYSSLLHHTGLCVHGITVPAGITGPVSTHSIPALIIYDPADTDLVKSGSTVDWQQVPKHIIDMESTFSIITGLSGDIGGAKAIDGSYFDPVLKILYLDSIHADCGATGNCSSFSETLVHAFQLNDTPAPAPVNFQETWDRLTSHQKRIPIQVPLAERGLMATSLGGAFFGLTLLLGRKTT
jgi:hypothetical protein